MWQLDDEMTLLSNTATTTTGSTGINNNEGGDNEAGHRSLNDENITTFKPDFIANPTDKINPEGNDESTNLVDLIFTEMVTFKRDGRLYVCTMSMLRKFRIYDFPQFTMTCERRLERRAVLDTVCFENIAISPDGTLLVSASLTTPRIQLLSTKDLSSIHTMYGLFPKRVRSLAFSPKTLHSDAAYPPQRVFQVIAAARQWLL